MKYLNVYRFITKDYLSLDNFRIFQIIIFVRHFKRNDTKRYEEILKTCINSVELNCETYLYQAHTTYYESF